jgi:hypothetical protein
VQAAAAAAAAEAAEAAAAAAVEAAAVEAAEAEAEEEEAWRLPLLPRLHLSQCHCRARQPHLARFPCLPELRHWSRYGIWRPALRGHTWRASRRSR